MQKGHKLFGHILQIKQHKSAILRFLCAIHFTTLPEHEFLFAQNELVRDSKRFV